LFQTALIQSGYEIADPTDLVNKMFGLMSKNLGVDPNAEVKDIDVPEKPEPKVEEPKEEAKEEEEGEVEEEET